MKRAARNALALLILSTLTAYATAMLAGRFIPVGAGLPAADDIRADFFRFDSFHYLDIVENGYRYDGNPASSPNIVFAPLFPFLVDSFAYLPGLDVIRAGYFANALLLFAAFFFLTRLLEDFLSPRAAFATLAALGTSAGAYSLHAYYSEPAMLAALAFALLALKRGWWWSVGLAAAALGASRLAALPMVLAFGILLARRRHPAAVLAPLGSALYLGFLWLRYGEPFSMLHEIQATSWGRFHPPTKLWPLVTGEYLWTYAGEAAARGASTFTDIQSLNLAWMLLALGAGVFAVTAKSLRATFAPIFVPYVLFIYATAASSPFLISVHRFAVVVVPLFMAGAYLHDWLARRVHAAAAYAVSISLFTLNLAYGFLHAAMFNQGHWFWF